MAVETTVISIAAIDRLRSSETTVSGRLVFRGGPVLPVPLMDAEDVPLGVLEPRRPVGTHHAHVPDGLQAGKIVVLEHDAALLHLGDLGHDVEELEAESRMLGLRAVRLRAERN